MPVSVLRADSDADSATDTDADAEADADADSDTDVDAVALSCFVYLCLLGDPGPYVGRAGGRRPFKQCPCCHARRK